MGVRKITVGICNFKQKKWLYRCLRSLASQTISKDEFEVIIVNDDPDEDLDDIVASMSDLLNLRLFNNSKNCGLPHSLNRILHNARGRYFFRVDADDYISKHTLYMMSLFLDMNRDYQAVACDYNDVDDVGVFIRRHSAEKEPIACGVMFTYESLCSVGFYNEQFKMREGHELLKRYVDKHHVFYCQMPFYRYRKHDTNRTGNVYEVAVYDKKLEND